MLLLTGATGFVGRRVLKALGTHGLPIRCLVHTPAWGEVIQSQADELVYGDVLAPASLREAVRGVEGIVHLVAIVREKGPQTFERVNLRGTRNLLEAAKEAGVNKFIHASTIGAADDPTIPYLRSRWLAEQEIIKSGVPYAILRSSLLFGEGDEFFNTLAALVKALPVVPIAGDGEAKFQPLAVEDFAECVARALGDKGVLGKVLEVGGPEHITYEGLIDLVCETLQRHPPKVHLPLSMMRPVVSLMDALLPRPPVTSEQLKMLKIDNTADLNSVEEIFGFTPKSVRGNIDYITQLSYMDSLKINLGFMPEYVRDH